MSFLKSLIRRVKRTVTAVAGVAIGGALSSAAGAVLRPLGSSIGRNLTNLARRAGGFLQSVFTRKANALVTKNIPPPSSTFGGGGSRFA
jgi:hypothetical protein